MGKRELLLGAAFVLIGVLVYQVTAPAADPAKPGWSVGGIIERMRREVRGNQAQAKHQATSTIPADDSVRELRITVGSVNVTVIGEDRSDVQADLDVTSNAYDTAEAERTAKATRVKVDRAGAVITLSVDFPQEGRQRAALALKVPSRFEIRAEKNNSLTISNVAAAIVMGRGQTTIKDVPGTVQVEQRGNVVTLSDIGPLRLRTLAGAEAKVTNVRGDAMFSLQGGELRGESIEGTIEIEARNCDIKLEKLETSRRPIRINASGAEIEVLGVQTEMRIDGREADIRVEQSAPAPLSIYNEGNETVEVTLPSGGLKVDAVTIDGKLTVDEALEKSGVKITSTSGTGGETGSSREEHRVEATLRGGGPLVTIRARHGDIMLRSR